MQQVLFYIPIFKDSFPPNGIPINGYGFMMLMAFLGTIWLLGKWSKVTKDGLPSSFVQNLIIIMMISGFVGGRITYCLQFGVPLTDIYKVWNGGLVLLGGVLLSILVFIALYQLYLRRLGVKFWRLADTAGPVLALGIALGRLGCLLNGCCYGHVAPDTCPAIQFPMLNAPARDTLVEKLGYQTVLGFTVYPEAPNEPRLIVKHVEPLSEAGKAGLQPRDRIVKINDEDLSLTEFSPVGRLDQIVLNWPRGKKEMTLVVERDQKETTLPTFIPRSIRLHPTQLYETISMLLLMTFLMLFDRYRRHDGQVFTLFLLGYGIHRFLNEILRNDTPVEGFSMTLSQNISVGLILLAISFEIGLRIIHGRGQAVSAAIPPNPATNAPS
ncbi:MAG: prolipoprotein diacylglyceryl transferase [Zavarzinella sp.]